MFQSNMLQLPDVSDRGKLQYILSKSYLHAWFSTRESLSFPHEGSGRHGVNATSFRLRDSTGKGLVFCWILYDCYMRFFACFTVNRFLVFSLPTSFEHEPLMPIISIQTSLMMCTLLQQMLIYGHYMVMCTNCHGVKTYYLWIQTAAGPLHIVDQPIGCYPWQTLEWRLERGDS